MKQAIVILLKKDKKIEEIRKKYVPDYKKFRPHISLVYNFKNIKQKELREHIVESIKEIKQFDFVLKGLRKSTKQYYLYLLVNVGKNKFIKIHKKLNSNILSGFQNKDMPSYIPHITLGVFKNKKEIDKAILELKKEKIKFKATIKSIQLITLKKDVIKSIKNFRLR